MKRRALHFVLGQVEEWEADLEGLQSAQTKKSRSKVDKEKLAKLDENLSRHRRHIERLEQMYRLLDNEALEVPSLLSPFIPCLLCSSWGS